MQQPVQEDVIGSVHQDGADTWPEAGIAVLWAIICSKPGQQLLDFDSKPNGRQVAAVMPKAADGIMQQLSKSLDDNGEELVQKMKASHPWRCSICRISMHVLESSLYLFGLYLSGLYLSDLPLMPQPSMQHWPVLYHSLQSRRNAQCRILVNARSSLMLQGLVLFKIDGDEWALDLRSGKGKLTKGSPEGDTKPDLTLTISDENFAKLVMGKLGPQQVHRAAAETCHSDAACFKTPVWWLTWPISC